MYSSFPITNMAPSIGTNELEYIFARMETTFSSKRIRKDETKILHTLLNEGEKFYRKFKKHEHIGS